MDKTFDPAAVEQRVRGAWESADAFRAGRPDRAGAPPYSIVIPPPNVTGSLHIGHALNNTLQDVLCRFERMRGRDVLWQPGMDHAGIATQMVVERQLAERQQPDRHSMGREAFVQRVWAWKEESGGQIVSQLKRLGASCDWSRERFTMDEGLSKAVTHVFVTLHRQGLIYKDKRLVNWDPRFQTALSDIEVLSVETKGSLWHFNYPIEGLEGRFITVATTRPETLLGDTAVAVHPDDERYTDLIGRFAILPLVGRRIPIVADPYADPEKGSGAVKITPAHDFNDFEVGRRHQLPLINILDSEARISLQGNLEFLAGLPTNPENYDLFFQLEGLDRFVAREQIVAAMDERGLLAAVEPNQHAVPHGDRSNAVVEPWLTDQWYVDAATLARPALVAVREGQTTFIPKTWEKTYFDWLENIQPWCISRQLWWGHRIPAWYGRKRADDGGWVAISSPEVFVAASEAEATKQASELYGCKIRVLAHKPSGDLDPAFQEIVNAEIEGKDSWEWIWRDEDVLDTWFSSALWPFSTLGWPEHTPELARYYPTSTLVTGFDIIFFWVARMMMMGLHFTGEVPFKDVYMHALVRDEKGAKMSKSKGNVIDPIELIDRFGADALRFTLAAMAAQGRDIKLATSRVEGYRNFATKLWNAARFAEMNGCARVAGFEPGACREPLNRWIVGEAAQAASEVTAALEAFRFNDAAAAIYRFAWNVFCDWYVELAKPILTGPDGVAKTETRAATAYVIDEILTILHPFMPFLTEELWAIKGEQGPPRTSLLALSPWPASGRADDGGAAAEINWIIDLISDIRSIRSELNVPPSAQPPLLLVEADADASARVERWGETLRRMARLSGIETAAAVPGGSVQILVSGAAAVLPLADFIDVAVERTRLGKDVSKIEGEITKIDAKLDNPDFVMRAPEAVIEENRERRAEAIARAEKLRQAMARLASP